MTSRESRTGCERRRFVRVDRVEFFIDGHNAESFTEPLSDPESLIVRTISILEVSGFVLRRRGGTDALQAVAAMRRGEVVDLDGELALLAAQLGLEKGLPLADSVIYATAQRVGAVLWTQDEDFVDLAHAHRSADLRSRPPTFAHVL